jgi:type III secretion protein Q
VNAPLILPRLWQPPAPAADATRLADRLLRRRAPITLPGQWSVQITLPESTATLHALDACIGEQHVRLGLPPPLVAELGAQGDDPLLDALLAEHALAPLLAPLEQALAASVRFARLTPECPPLVDAAELGLVFHRGPERLAGSLVLPAALLPPLADALDRLPAAQGMETLLLPLSLRIASTRLALGMLATLCQGDALLPLHGPLPERRLLVVLAERLCWPAQLAAGAAPGQAVVRITGPAVLAQHAHQEWTMSEPVPATAVADAALDEIEVTLVFEVGRVALTLAEIKALAPGRLLPLPPGGTPRVEVLAHGRRLGTGEIVRVGEELAVRLLAWNGA